MTLTKQAVVLGITDAKIATVTTNSSTTYAKGSYVDAPGIKEVTVSLIADEKEATGDETILANFILKKGYELSFSNAMVDLTVVSTINGSTVASSGGNDTEVASLTEFSTDVPVEFNFHFKTDYVDGDTADFHMEYYVCKGHMDIIPRSGDVYEMSFKGKAYSRLSDKAIRCITMNETVAAIS
ncbi:MAG: hypothetical protein US20_C0005G0005 [Candidatus Pacebacteria bacterium GW2011_GWF1_36_5]|nr:MAG: hypothetical protein US20_C0005G0005 [Candidatus Pacebacteria bacterium GW2011_GWF1_36_5]